jgi:hypothetical protein
MTKLLIFLAVWKRPEITEICFMGINRLKKSRLFDIEAFAVISEASMAGLCSKYGINYCFHENQPLGEKKNFGLGQAMEFEWDYTVEMGSDDVLKDEYLSYIAPHIGREMIGINNVAYINTETGDCREYQTNDSFGMGRAVKRSVFERWGTNVWNPNINRGLDGSSNLFFGRRGVMEKKIKCSEPVGIDIKSPTNIWPFRYDIGKEYDIEKALSGLSEGEKEGIKNLIHVTV